MILVLLSGFVLFGKSISELASLFKEANFFDKDYYFKNHIIVFGQIGSADIIKFLFNILDKYHIDYLPKILVVGNKLIEDTDFETLFKNEVFKGKIYYLS